jgi:effector-binding domain-containing protein
MSFECEFVDREEQPTLAIRTHTPVEGLPQLIGASYGRIMQYLASIGERYAGEPFVVYHNLDMQNLDVELGFPVLQELPGKDDIQPGKVSSGKYGVCHYTGPYEQMEPAYQALNDMIKENGFETTGIAYEYYLNGPQDATPEGYKTRIEFPLK